MAGFVRRFTNFPSLAVIAQIEGVVIVDLIPPGIFLGRTTGTVCLVGEWPGGPVNTPTVVEGDQTIRDTFGGFSLSLTDPLSYSGGAFTNPWSNGCAFAWLKSKSFQRLVLVRVDMSLAEGVHLTLGGTPTTLTEEVTIPAGTRVRDASATGVEFALAYDVTFAVGVDNSAAGATAFDAARTTPYTTRTVSDIPVYSTKGTDEGAVGDVDTVDTTDLFRAGIGAGTGLPSLTVAVTTGAIVADSVAANAAVLTALTSANIDTRYGNAITAALPGETATNNIDVIAAARQSAAIRTALLANAAAASAESVGRVAVIRPPIGTNLTSASGSSSPGVGATRGDRAIYCFPHFLQRLPELAELDPGETISTGATALIGADAAAATLLSLLPPEENPGQSTSDVVSGGILNQFILSLETGLTTSGQPTRFTRTNYTAMKTAGIMGLRFDPAISEWIFQSGVTSVDPAVYPQLAPIKRRRMADFVQDSMAAICLRHDKKLQTEARKSTLVGELVDFLETLKSTENPAAQRIADYSIDTRSGNTATLQGAGVFVLVISVQLLDDFRNIVLQAQIGETVSITATPV